LRSSVILYIHNRCSIGIPERRERMRSNTGFPLKKWPRPFLTLMDWMAKIWSIQPASVAGCAWPKAVWGEYWLSRIPKGDVTMKKSHGLSARGERTVKKGRPTRSKKIDFSDIPELSENQLSRMRRTGRPTLGDEPRRLIAIRVDAKVLEWLRRTAAEMGVPYQSLVNQILAEEMRKAS
jgi:uncharacterized protein (DUF4415 family)